MVRGVQPANSQLAVVIKSVLESLTDISGPVVLRAAGGTMPLTFSTNTDITVGLKQQLTPVLTDVFIGLLVATVNNRKIETSLSLITQIIYERLGSHIPYHPLLKSIRAALRASLPISRVEKVEELRRCTQAINDEISNSFPTRHERSIHLGGVDKFTHPQAD